MRATLKSQAFQDFEAPKPPASQLVAQWLGRNWQMVALGCLTLLALALRLYRLDVPSYFKGYDEGWTFFNSAHPLNLIIPYLWPDHSPLFFLAYHFVLDALNYTHDKVWLRLPSVLIGTLTVPATFLLARQLVGNVKLALLAGFGVAIVPLLVELSRHNRMYSLLALLSVLSAYSLLRALRSGRWQDWAAFVLSTILNLYNHYDALFATAELGLFAGLYLLINLLANSKFAKGWLGDLKTFERRQIWGRVLGSGLSFAAIGVLYLPWLSHFMNFIQTPEFGVNRGFAKVGLDFGTIYEFVSQASFGHGLGFWVGLPLSLLGLAALLYRRFYYGLFCLVYFWGLLLILVNLPHTSSSNLLVSPRYYCFITPVYIITIAQGVGLLTRLTAWVLKRFKLRPPLSRPLVFAPGVVLLALLVFQVGQEFASQQIYEPQRTYLEDTTDFLRKNLQSTDVVLMAAPRIQTDFFRRNQLVAQILIFEMTPNRAADALLWPHFAELEKFNTLANIGALKTSTARTWLLAVLDGTADEVAAKKQQVEQVAANNFESHCFDLICLISPKAANRPNQYADFQSFFQTFGFLNEDFGREARIFDAASQPLQPLALTTPASLSLGRQPTFVKLPIVTPNVAQIYCIKYQYQGSPSRIEVGAQNQQGQNIAVMPDWDGYQPPPSPINAVDWQSDSLLFEAPPGTAHASLTLFGENGPAQIKNIQLFKLGDK